MEIISPGEKGDKYDEEVTNDAHPFQIYSVFPMNFFSGKKKGILLCLAQSRNN